MRVLLILAWAAASFGQSFHLETAIPLSAVEGRIDHMAVDPASKRLAIAALGNNTVEVLDIAAGKRIQTLTGVREPQGIAFAPDLRRFFVASGQDGKLRAYDSATLQLVSEMTVGEDADNVRYELGRKRVWVGHGAGALALIDPTAMKKLADIALDAHPESFQLETSGSRIFVNVPNASEVEVLDREKRAVIAKWPIKDGEANFPMALDESGRRLFIACRKPPRLLVLDTDSGKVTFQITCAGDADDMFFDSARRYLYIVGGDGHLQAFYPAPSGQYFSFEIATAPGARTGLFSPDLGRLFLAVPHRGDQHAELRVYSIR